MPFGINDHTAPQSVTLSAEQFDKLVELLTPINEFARQALAATTVAMPEAPEPVDNPSEFEG